MRPKHRSLRSSGRPLPRASVARPKALHLLDAPQHATGAGLRYVSDAGRGIRRLRHAKGFRYVALDGATLRDADERARIRALAIPPAWTGVWISPHPHGHLQATGRDSKGRKQYRYHARWRQVRDEVKYGRMIAFAKTLGEIRGRIDHDLRRHGLPREKVLATIVRLLETTLIRVGNEEYARQNRSYGLTTLRDSHVDVSGATLEFRFRGKSRKDHVVGLQDRRLSRIVKRCRDLPGRDLFQYLDARERRRSIESADVNSYLKEITEQDFTAKDFRTWAGTVLAASALREMEGAPSARRAHKNVVRAMESVAARLGNTPAICRKSYVHPAIVDAYLDGSLIAGLRRHAGARLSGLRPEETDVLGLLEARAA